MVRNLKQGWRSSSRRVRGKPGQNGALEAQWWRCQETKFTWLGNDTVFSIVEVRVGVDYCCSAGGQSLSGVQSREWEERVGATKVDILLHLERKRGEAKK